LSGDGAATRGARFNPKGMPALYLALEPMTAIKEANQGFAHKIEPCVICAYEIDCDDLVDLTTEETMRTAGASRELLGAAWFSALVDGREPPQWDLVRRLRSDGAAGALVPSFAAGAHEADHNLTLWDWGPRPPHKVVVFDPSGRLPRNQLSWE
jgi:RES domain-containing protein